MSIKICPKCEKDLNIQSIPTIPGSETFEDVWVCNNKECENYDEIVYTMEDFA